MAIARRARRFTVEEYDRMVEVGILGADDHLELIEGEILEMAPIGPPHESVVDRLNMLLARGVGERAVVRVQSSIPFPGLCSRPQPDLAVLKPRGDFYRTSGPGAGDILLLIEVMEASASYDRGRKAPLYARAGVSELWLVDIPGGLLEVHRTPSSTGYRDLRLVRGAESVSPAAFPDLVFPLPEILG